MRLDHHCPWLGTCVAMRNYRYFFLFLMHGFLLALLDLGMSIAHIIHNSQYAAEGSLGISCVILFLSVFGIVFLGNLSYLHLRLLWRNVTTKEKLYGRFAELREPNPFDR